MAHPSQHGQEINTQELWAKYEDTAMHFNDLLMRLRSQSIAGIAAISTVVGIFAKDEGPGFSIDWLVATAIFVAMAIFWFAIWCLDFLYYNRLLCGAVAGLIQIEKETQQARAATSINLSTTIEQEFEGPLFTSKTWHFRGVLMFYLVVFVALVAGAGFCLWAHWTTPPCQLGALCLVEGFK